MVEGPHIDQSDHALKGCDAVLDHARPVRVQHVGARCHRLAYRQEDPLVAGLLQHLGAIQLLHDLAAWVRQLDLNERHTEEHYRISQGSCKQHDMTFQNCAGVDNK